MIGFLIALALGFAGKWRWLGMVWLLDLVAVGAFGLMRASSDFPPEMVLIVPLVEVPFGYLIGALLYRRRKNAWPRDKAIAELAPVTHDTNEAGDPLLTWEIEAPILTPQLARVSALGIGTVFIVLFGVFVLMGGGDVAAAAGIVGIGCACVAALFLFVVFVLFFNRLRRRYVLSPTGYATVITDPRMLAGVAAAGTVGTATRDATMTGSALTGAANMSETRAWNTVAEALPDPARHRIRLQLRRLGWLGVDTIFCHAEGFGTVETWIAGRIGRA